MASSCPEEVKAMRQLGELVTGLGLSHVVYLLAALAEERRDVSLSVQDARARRSGRTMARYSGRPR